MSSNQQVLYTTEKIRAGYEAADVTLWQSLLQQAKTEQGDSIKHLFLILDMARHNECDVLDIVKTGRVCSGYKTIDDKFMFVLTNCMNDVTEEEVTVIHGSTKVLDLTCDESSVSSSSHSYEETSEQYNANPTSGEAYEIDGFVVEDHSSGSSTPVTSIRQFNNNALSASDWLLKSNQSTTGASAADAVASTSSKKKLRKRKLDKSEQ